MNPLPSSLQRLRDLPPFSSCTPSELAFVDDRIWDYRATAGEVLTAEGRTGRELIVIVEGTAVIRVGSREVARLGPGDVVGEVALLDHGSRTATVIAETDVDALVAGSAEFAEILSAVPAVARALLVALARRVRAADELLAADEWTPVAERFVAPDAHLLT
jgi:CRP/FNR family cyclic AMP-dependent transcriptional regulator